MGVYVYPIVDISVPLSNVTITRVKEFPVKRPCSSDLLTDPCCGWNYTHCPSDTDYYQPYCVANSTSVLKVCDGLTQSEINSLQRAIFSSIELVLNAEKQAYIDTGQFIGSVQGLINAGYLPIDFIISNSYYLIGVSELSMLFPQSVVVNITSKSKCLYSAVGKIQSNVQYSGPNTDYTNHLIKKSCYNLTIGTQNPLSPISVDNDTIVCAEGSEDIMQFNYKSSNSTVTVNVSKTDSSNPCFPCNDGSTGCIKTDMLYFQFQLPDVFNDWENGIVTHRWSATKTGNWLATLEIMSPYCCEAGFDEIVEDSLVGYVSKTQETYQQVIINPTILPPVFFIKFTFNFGGTEKSYYSEQYQRVTCESTILVEGLRPDKGAGSKDCNNYYYGLFDLTDGSNFIYRNIQRIYGGFEQVSFDIQKETVKNNVTESSFSEKYKLRTSLLPPYVIKRLREQLLASKLLVNEKEFLFKGTVDKNNDIGNMWLLDLTLEVPSNINCIQRFGCV